MLLYADADNDVHTLNSAKTSVVCNRVRPVNVYRRYVERLIKKTCSCIYS